MEEREILSLLLQRNEAAIAALEAAYGKRLLALARNILPTDGDAQECVNDTYLALWNATAPQQPELLTPYVLRVCKNIAVSKLRQLTAQKRSGYEVALDELSEVIGTRSLEEALSAKELGQAIDHFLGKLHREDRVIFLRRHWYGDSMQEIARKLGRSENHISVRLSRTRTKLKKYLTKEGLL